MSGSSTESDEDKVRHDRFRSERFRRDSSNNERKRDGRPRGGNLKHDNYSSKRERNRSPHRDHKHRRKLSPYKTESRRSHSSKLRSKEYNSQDLKNDRAISNKSQFNKSIDEDEKKVETKTNTKKLSSLLMNFDKQVESKRIQSENLQIGPALPLHLQEKVDNNKESCESNEPHQKGLCVGTACLQSINLNRKEESDDENPREVGVENILHLKDKSGSSENISENIEFQPAEGPALPPHLKNSNSSENTASELVAAEDKCSPDLSETNLYGPSLPPKVEPDSYGPALPPNFKKPTIQGPTLPENMTVDNLEKLAQEESDDEDMVGPLPEGKMNMTQFQLDLRAMDIKRKLEEEKNGPSVDIKKREEWMLELPPEKASNLGLGPRSFRMREAPDMSNRSGWTDTPADKLRKEQQALQGEVVDPISNEDMAKAAFIQERNEAMAKMVELGKSENRQESLLEMHQKKLKKKKKKEEKEGKKKERRPFDRNIDLQVNRFDDAQKKAIFKKAQLLDTRFSTGESKFL